jgi:hypothetical protein
MPSLLVLGDGTAELQFATDRFTIAELYDADWTAIIVGLGRRGVRRPVSAALARDPRMVSADLGAPAHGGKQGAPRLTAQHPTAQVNRDPADYRAAESRLFPHG